jgi:hypothetical protein
MENSSICIVLIKYVLEFLPLLSVFDKICPSASIESYLPNKISQDSQHITVKSYFTIQQHEQVRCGLSEI